MLILFIIKNKLTMYFNVFIINYSIMASSNFIVEPVLIPITSKYAGALGLIYVFLMLSVIMRRLNVNVSLGTGNDSLLEIRIRGHGNFAENVPLCVIFLALIEIGGAPFWVLHSLAAPLVFGRLAHAYAFYNDPILMLGRVLGTAITVTFLCYASAILLFGVSWIAVIVGSIVSICFALIRFKIIPVPILNFPELSTNK